MAEKDGGPAFPRPDSPGYEDGHWGMSLRDYFAGQALTGIMTSPARIRTKEDAKGVPVLAYRLADAMLTERKEG